MSQPRFVRLDRFSTMNASPSRRNVKQLCYHETVPWRYSDIETETCAWVCVCVVAVVVVGWHVHQGRGGSHTLHSSGSRFQGGGLVYHTQPIEWGPNALSRPLLVRPVTYPLSSLTPRHGFVRPGTHCTPNWVGSQAHIGSVAAWVNPESHSWSQTVPLCSHPCVSLLWHATNKRSRSGCTVGHPSRTRSRFVHCACLVRAVT